MRPAGYPHRVDRTQVVDAIALGLDAVDITMISITPTISR